MKTKDKEIKDLEEIVSNLKISEANAIKEKGKLEKANQSLKLEKEACWERCRS